MGRSAVPDKFIHLFVEIDHHRNSENQRHGKYIRADKFPDDVPVEQIQQLQSLHGFISQATDYIL